MKCKHLDVFELLRLSIKKHLFKEIMVYFLILIKGSFSKHSIDLSFSIEYGKEVIKWAILVWKVILNKQRISTTCHVNESNRINVWRKTQKGLATSHWKSRQNGHKFSIMVCQCLYFKCVGAVCLVEGNLNSANCIGILDTNLLLVIARISQTKVTFSKTITPQYIDLVKHRDG